jgi:hypothetical protein
MTAFVSSLPVNTRKKKQGSEKKRAPPQFRTINTPEDKKQKTGCTALRTRWRKIMSWGVNHRSQKRKEKYGKKKTRGMSNIT